MKVAAAGPCLIRSPIDRLGIEPLLVMIGFPRSAVYQLNRKRNLGTYWYRNEGKLEYLLKDARELFRARMKQIHPDIGGSNDETVQLNQAWTRIQKLFARHGAHLNEAPLTVEEPSRMEPYARLYGGCKGKCSISFCLPYASLITKLNAEGVMTKAAIWRVLQGQGFAGNYYALRKFIQKKLTKPAIH
jgi:hypothetical protein